ncbi:MAG: hypothetical protein U9O85_00320 [Euryarchaeota archaeon]|nr:hypothetical protein [Euryarchaeota archaeon]
MELTPGRPLKKDIRLENVHLDVELAEIRGDNLNGYVRIFRALADGYSELIILFGEGKVVGCEESYQGIKRYGREALEGIFLESGGYLDIVGLTEEELNAIKRRNPEANLKNPLDIAELFVPGVSLETNSDEYVAGEEVIATFKVDVPIFKNADVKFSISSSADEKCLFEEEGVLASGEQEKEYRAILKDCGVARAVAQIAVGEFERVVEKEIEILPFDFQLFAELNRDSFTEGRDEELKCLTRVTAPEYIIGKNLRVLFQLFADGELVEKKEKEVTLQEETGLEEIFELKGDLAGPSRLVVTAVGDAGVEKSVELPFEIFGLKASLELEKEVHDVGDDFLAILNISMHSGMKEEVAVLFSLTIDDDEVFSEAGTITVEGETRRDFRTVIEKAGKAKAVAKLRCGELESLVESSFDVLPFDFKLSAELDKEVYAVGEELRCVAKFIFPERLTEKRWEQVKKEMPVEKAFKSAERLIEKRMNVAFQLFSENELLIEKQERDVRFSGSEHSEEFRIVLNAPDSALALISAQGHMVKLPFKMKVPFEMEMKDTIPAADELSVGIKSRLKEEGLGHLIIGEEEEVEERAVKEIVDEVIKKMAKKYRMDIRSYVLNIEERTVNLSFEFKPRMLSPVKLESIARLLVKEELDNVLENSGLLTEVQANMV